MRRLGTCMCAAWLAASSGLLAKEPLGKAAYCVQGAKGEWGLQRFKPLIEVQGGTVFAEMVFEGGVFRELRLRRFYVDSELTFDYTFDAAGRLTGLRGSVKVRSVPPPELSVGEAMQLADWLGEADLMPAGNGSIPPHHVVYTRENDRIEKPFNAEKYVARFDEAPVYLAAGSVPCAARMREAEKMDATQE